jgi:iron complex transport system permease protein
VKDYKKKKSNLWSSSAWLLIMAGLLAIMVFSVLAAVTFGNADITIKEVYGVIGSELFQHDSMSGYSEGAVHDVVWLIRLPRVLLALAIGMGLSVCGVVMQAIVKNPLADPYVLGISSGASLGATLAIMLGVGTLFGSNSVGIMAFIGAMLASFAVVALANAGGRANSAKLILTGLAISSVCSAFASFTLFIANDRNALGEVTYWTMGSLSGARWENVAVILPVLVAGTLIFWTQFRNLNLMLLGDETSITLGTDLHKIRIIYLILVSVMVGCAVYASGVIGFVGLIIPHITRMIVGTDHRKTLPLSALLGAVFLIWADVASRIILEHSEMPIGILVAIIGSPCFIYLLTRRAYGREGGKS